MKKSLKTYLTAGAIVAVVGLVGTAGALTVAHAATTTNSTVSNFISQVATKIGISSDKLQAAVDSTRTDIQTQTLSTAVTSGKMTQAQADVLQKIETYRQTEQSTETAAARQTEMTARKTAMDALPSTATPTERQAAMQKIEDQNNQTMATALGIDISTINDALTAAKTAGIGGPGMGGRGMGGGRGGMHEGGMGMRGGGF